MKKSKVLSNIVLISMILSLLISCNEEDIRTETLVVASQRIVTESEGCPYWVKKQNSTKWEIFYNQIANFDYEEGYEYIIEVEVTKVNNPGPDQSRSLYTLLKIKSKIKKDSDAPFFTNNLSLCKTPAEKAFPCLKKEVITLPNGLTVEKIDSLYIIQGDIVLNEKRLKALMNQPLTRSGRITASVKYWPKRKVYYTFRSGFTLQSNVLAAISEWSQKTNLTFILGTGNGNYIEFFNGDGNYSNSLGMAGGKQLISLSRDGSNIGSAIHEIGHAVGLIHEQCRNDRDNYITIHWNNIVNDYISQFNIYPIGQTMDIGSFDFSSVMLYGSTAFSKDGSYSMTTKDGYYFDGQRIRLSTGDVEGVKSIYGPPFHKLSVTTDITREQSSGLEDITEYSRSHIIYFYADEACTQRTTLPYPRNITVVTDTQSCSGYGEKVYNQRYSETITVPAGVSSFDLGTTQNTEWLTMGNPQFIDITNYSIVEL